MQSQISCHFSLYSEGIDRDSGCFADVNALPNHLFPHGESLVCLSQCPVYFAIRLFFLPIVIAAAIPPKAKSITARELST